MTVRKRALVVPTPRQGSPFPLPQPLPPTPSGKPEPPGHPAARPATSSLQRPAATPRSPYRSASSVSPANGWRFANLSQTRLPGGKPRERRGGSRLRSRLAAATPTAAPPRPSRSVGPAQLSRPTGRVAETAGGGGAHARRGWSRGAKNRKLGDKVRSSAPRRRCPAVWPSRTRDPLPTHPPGARVHHVWFLQRHRHEESSSTAPAGGWAQPREGKWGRAAEGEGKADVAVGSPPSWPGRAD